MTKVLHEEQGAALITAVLVTMVVVIMALTVTQIGFHNLDQSANDRRRLQAVHAAEMGLDRFYLYLEKAGSTPKCILEGDDLQISPTPSFRATATYFDAATPPGVIPCDSNDLAQGTPAAVRIRSQGEAGPQGATSKRVMETYANLRQLPGGDFGTAAVFGYDMLKTDKATVFGNPDDADVYSNGILELKSGPFWGSAYSQGTVVTSSGVEIKGDIWSDGSQTISGNTVIRGSVTSGTSWIKLSGSGTRVEGDARACTYIDNKSTILGSVTEGPPCAGPPPSGGGYPTFTYLEEDWLAKGYKVETFPATDSAACTKAADFIAGDNPGPKIQAGESWVVRVMRDCTLVPKSTGSVVKGNLAIILNGGIDKPRFRSEPPSAQWDLHLIVGQKSPPSSQCQFKMSSDDDYFENLNTLIYTPNVAPCLAVINSSRPITGQIYSNHVSMAGSGAQLNYRAVSVPGFGIGGWEIDIVYIREVTS